MKDNLDNEINYKEILGNNLKNKFLVFPFISEKEINKEVDKIYSNLDLSSKIISYNNDFLSYLMKDKFSNYELMLKLNGLAKKINTLNNKKYCQQEYELINSLYESLNHKLYQNIIDEMIYKISYTNSIYDNTEILSYMLIDNKFYLKIANELKLGNENDNMDIILSVLDNKFLSINKLVRLAVIKYYENDYNQSLIDELVEETLKTYDGTATIIEHVKQTVKEKSVKRKILINAKK